MRRNSSGAPAPDTETQRTPLAKRQPGPVLLIQRTPPSCLGNRAQSHLVLCLLSLIEFPPAPFSRHPTTRTGQQSQLFGARESRPQAVLE